jgi:Ca-activated chloride channel family protein
MKLLLSASALIAAAVAVLSPQAAAQAPPQTFRATTSAVVVDASVRDAAQKPLPGLSANDFRVLDNGVPQTVTEVSFGTRPIDVTIGLDISGSVTGSVLSELRIAVVRLLGDLKPGDRLRLLLFSSKMQRVIDFTTDAKAVEAAMRSTPPGGRTALYDTLSVALVTAAEPDRRQLVVFFTDGEDSGSKTTQPMLHAVAQRTRATTTFVVSTMSELPFAAGTGFAVTSSHRVNPFLMQLADTTGGLVLPVETATDVGMAFKKILNDFRSSYVLFFTPTGVERSGFHNLSVEVTRPGVTVQARRSYLGDR